MTCKEICEAYEEGGISLRETLYLATREAAAGDVEKNLRSLPLVWRKELELYIFDTYDNDIEPESFVYIGRDEPDLGLRRKVIATLRAWIAVKKVSEHFDRNAE